MINEKLLPSTDGSRRTLLSLFLAALMVAVLYQTISASPDGQETLPADQSDSGGTVDSDETNASDTPGYGMEASITQTVAISSSEMGISSTAQMASVAVSDTVIYMPFVGSVLPQTLIRVLELPNANNQWTIGFWSEFPIRATGYEIQEAQDPNFTGAALIQVDDPAINSIQRTKNASSSNSYYYRARTKTITGLGPWSAPIMVAGNYFDDFSSSGSGWRMVRQDTDDIDQRVYYSNGRLIHRQHGRWDYLVSSPTMPAPKGAYRLEARARFVGQDNLHTLGLVFGGDSSGSTCPNNSYSSCFNHYYRLLAIWFSNDSGKLRIQLKRIDYHDRDDNAGRGVTLIDYKDVKVNSPPSSWQTWRIDVDADGSIKIYVNDNLVARANDTKYLQEPYFGGFSATNEYAGLQVEFDWIKVSSQN